MKDKSVAQNTLSDDPLKIETIDKAILPKGKGDIIK